MHLTSSDALATKCDMNLATKAALAILLALAACIDPPELPIGDCMGSLPDARTITIAPGDPIPGSIINEIQDVIVAGSRSAYSPKYPAACLAGASVGKFSVVSNPVLGRGYVVKFTSTGGDNDRLAVPFVVGNSMSSGKLSVYGDGAVDVTALLTVVAQDGTFVIDVASGTLNNAPASWSTISIANIASHVMADTEILQLKISNAGGAGNFYVDGLVVTQSRP